MGAGVASLVEYQPAAKVRWRFGRVRCHDQCYIMQRFVHRGITQGEPRLHEGGGAASPREQGAAVLFSLERMRPDQPDKHSPHLWKSFIHDSAFKRMPFTFTRRVTGSGAVSYSCETLTEIVRRLHQQAGIEGGNASAARRTFAVRLHRDGRSLKLIQQLLGVSSLSAVKNLIQGDPVRLSSIVSGVI
jgi:hypothetical protein